MHWKRTTAPDGIPGSPGPPAHGRLLPPKRNALTGASRTAYELVRYAPRIKHRPTPGQLWLMTRLDGRRPSTYRLDERVNELPACRRTSRTAATGCASRTPAVRSSPCRTAGASRCELTHPGEAAAPAAAHRE